MVVAVVLVKWEHRQEPLPREGEVVLDWVHQHGLGCHQHSLIMDMLLVVVVDLDIPAIILQVQHLRMELVVELDLCQTEMVLPEYMAVAVVQVQHPIPDNHIVHQVVLVEMVL
jgi:hypothetical protein